LTVFEDPVLADLVEDLDFHWSFCYFLRWEHGTAADLLLSSKEIYFDLLLGRLRDHSAPENSPGDSIAPILLEFDLTPL